jgi:hypothetical protein
VILDFYCKDKFLLTKPFSFANPVKLNTFMLRKCFGSTINGAKSANQKQTPIIEEEEEVVESDHYEEFEKENEEKTPPKSTTENASTYLLTIDELEQAVVPHNMKPMTYVRGDCASSYSSIVSEQLLLGQAVDQTILLYSTMEISASLHNSCVEPAVSIAICNGSCGITLERSSH